MTHIEWFYTVQVGEGRWVVRHHLTDSLAGSIKQTAHGFRLRDEQARDLGGFDSIAQALEGLYDYV
jgi:hypothetical protein